MDLADILTKDQIVTDLKASNRWEAIDELIDVLVATGKIRPEDREAVASVVRKRETSMSTGIGFGIGIPHASTDVIQDVVGALGRSRKGVDFEALDNQPVKLVMLFLVPQGQFQKHLHTLANIAKLLHKAEFRKALEEAPDAETMMAIIRQHCGKKGRCLRGRAGAGPRNGAAAWWVLQAGNGISCCCLQRSFKNVCARRWRRSAPRLTWPPCRCVRVRTRSSGIIRPWL